MVAVGNDGQMAELIYAFFISQTYMDLKKEGR